MVDTNIPEEKKDPQHEQTTRSANQSPRQYHIVVTDVESGKRLMDTTTDIAIIGAVEREKTVGEEVPTSVHWVGNAQQAEQLLGIIAVVIGGYIYQRPMPGTMTVGRKTSDLKN